MSRLCRFITKHCQILGLLLLCLVFLPIWQLSHLQMDNSIDIWFDHEAQDYRDYREFRNKYGNDEWIMIAFKRNEYTTAAHVHAICVELESLVDIESVLDPLHPDDKMPFGADKLLLSADKQSQALLLQVNTLQDSKQRQDLMQQIDDILQAHVQHTNFHLAGPTVVSASLDQGSQQQSALLLPIAFVIACIGLYIAFRSLLLMSISVLASGFSVLWSLGLAVYFGMSINMVSIVLPVLLWVLSLTACIHIIYQFRYQASRGLSCHDAMFNALSHVLKPYFLASLTTAAGLLSLTSSHMLPVSDLGLFAAIGILVGFVCNLIIVPAALTFWHKYQNQHNTDVVHDIVFPQWIKEKRYLISSFAVLFIALPALLFGRFKVNSNILDFFKSDAKIVTDNRFIAEELTGLSTVEFDVTCQLQDRPQYLASISALFDDLEGSHLLVSGDHYNLRVTAFIDAMESARFNGIIQDLKAGLKQAGIDKQVLLTGSIVLLNNVQTELVQTQLRSFGIALLVVALVLVFIFRSFVYVIVGILVNIIPVATILLVMELADIPLNSATVMVASIALGIAVDDTVFFLVKLQAELSQTSSIEKAIGTAWSFVIKPLSQTSMIVSLGFLTLTLSTFSPIAYFGFLGAVAMLMAWLCDSVILPAVVLALKGRRVVS